MWGGDEISPIPAGSHDLYPFFYYDYYYLLTNTYLSGKFLSFSVAVNYCLIINLLLLPPFTACTGFITVQSTVLINS